MSKDKQVNVPSQSEDIVSVEELKKVLGTGDELNGGRGSDDGSGSGSGSDPEGGISGTYTLSNTFSFEGITWTVNGTATVIGYIKYVNSIKTLNVVSVNFDLRFTANEAHILITEDEVTYNVTLYGNSYSNYETVYPNSNKVSITVAHTLNVSGSGKSDDGKKSISVGPFTTTKSVTAIIEVKLGTGWWLNISGEIK